MPTPLRVLVAPDSFKGTFSSVRVASALAAGWQRARSEDRMVLRPMADGGEFFSTLFFHSFFQVQVLNHWKRTGPCILNHKYFRSTMKSQNCFPLHRHKEEVYSYMNIHLVY